MNYLIVYENEIYYIVMQIAEVFILKYELFESFFF